MRLQSDVLLREGSGCFLLVSKDAFSRRFIGQHDAALLRSVSEVLIISDVAPWRRD